MWAGFAVMLCYMPVINWLNKVRHELAMLMAMRQTRQWELMARRQIR